VNKRICPVRGYLRWLAHRGPSHGYLFVPIDRYGCISQSGALSYHSFSASLMRDLRDIGISEYNQYNTHSFRRGGAQYYLNDCGKSISQIRAWGGWKGDAIVRYLVEYGSTSIERHDFTRPNNTGLCKRCACQIDTL
jgi:hypothetical protein